MSITAALFLVAYLAGCLLALLRHPVFGLMTYVGVFYLHPPSRWWGGALPDFRWSLIAALVTLIAILLRPGSRQLLPSHHRGAFLGMLLFLGWIGIQTIWAVDFGLNTELFSLFAKYALLIGLIYAGIDSERHLKMFLWAHVLGCFYLGWLVFTTYTGGRFEGFGGPGIDDANTGALQIVTGIYVAASLLLAAGTVERLFLLGLIPLVVNALVATVSRSGFLSLGIGGLLFNYYAPKRFRRHILGFSILGLVLFGMLANPLFWDRISSIKYAGEEVKGVDTGASRLVILAAQWQMFLDHPSGCGHRCTAVLSPKYLPDRYLTTDSLGHRVRSSHNTPMTMLVEHGVPGVIFYVLFMVWTIRSVRSLAREYSTQIGFLPAVFPSVAGILGAAFVGDLFVDYLKLEVRIWFVALVFVLTKLNAQRREAGNSIASTSRTSFEDVHGKSVAGSLGSS